MQQITMPEMLFLKGGGEMGALIREYDWASTPLGIPETWPQSLRIALGIVLNSKFPMFIFWGEQLTCFYNDAYRPSLGANGKHPSALGKPGFDVWPEIWDDIKPLIDQIMAGGEGTWSEDNLLPIYRNGKLEDVYWTFSYSPIIDDDGKVGGVFVTCTETTSKVHTANLLKKSELHFRNLVKNAPVGIAIFCGDELVVEMANDAYLLLIGKKREEFIGKPLLESLPEVKSIIQPLAQEVLQTGKHAYRKEFEITLDRDGKNEPCYFNSIYEAIYEPDGSINGIMVVVNEVTELVLSRKKVEESEQHFRNLLEQAPDPILILKGEDLILEVANKPLLDVWQVDESAIGKAYLEILPEMKEQGFYEKLLDVLHNGVIHHGYETPVIFERNSGKEIIYFNFVYQPYREKNNEITGVLIMASNVTEHVISKKQLEENKADLNLAVEIGELGTFRIDVETNKATYSKRIMEWFGLRKQNLDLQEIFDRIDESDRERVSTEINKLLASKAVKLLDITYTVVNPETGRSRILRSKGMALFNELGQPKAITGIIQDITAQVAIQKKTEESEQNLRNIILQAPVAMCLLRGEDFVVEVANERMLETWGKPASELMNRPLFVGLPEAKNQGFEELLHNVFTTGETFSAKAVPVSLPRQGKIEVVYLNFVYEAYRQRNDEITGVMAVAVDVTDQVVARKKVELAEERARLAIESAELGVYEVNLLNGEMHTNTRFNNIFGFRESVGRDMYVTRILEEDLKIRQLAHEESLRTGNLLYEVRVIYNDSLHWVRARGIVLFDEKNIPFKLLGVVQDITEQKIFAEALTKQVADKTKDYQEAMEQLVKKNQELEQFAYVASHDLKEPLRMISSYSDLLVRRIPQDIEAKEYSFFMTEGVQRMQALINDLLEYSRIGQKPVPCIKTDCNAVLKSALDALHIKIEETGAEVNYAQLPAVMGVPSLLSQLFQNLVDNAIKFRRKNTTPHIEIKAFPQGDKWYQFAISDNGIGIDKIYMEKIFVIFQRLHTRDQYPGTGIGLSVCKRIVELHGGKIWVESVQGQGTTFYFTLPKA